MIEREKQKSQGTEFTCILNTSFIHTCVEQFVVESIGSLIHHHQKNSFLINSVYRVIIDQSYAKTGRMEQCVFLHLSAFNRETGFFVILQQ